jgi:hypothetical protein
MRRGLLALLSAAVLATALPAAATPRQVALLPGQAFRVAGTRVGCWVVETAPPPSVACALWGRTTRIIPGTMSIRLGEDAVDVFLRPLEGELSLLREVPQPPAPAPPTAPPPAEPGLPGTTKLFAGDVASLPGTDISCAVVRRGALGARCGRVDSATGQLVAASALVTLTERNVLAARVNPEGIASTVFYERQPFVPGATTVAGQLVALARAARRLAVLRRIYRGTLRGYREAFSRFRAIEDDLRHDRFIASCAKFTPLLYEGFYLPRGSVAGGPGLRFLASVRRIERALCG